MIKFFEEEFAIDSDRHQWRVLRRRGKDDDDQDKYVPEMYFVTFAGAVKGLFNNRVKDSEYESLVELANRMEEVYKEIQANLGHIKLPEGNS